MDLIIFDDLFPDFISSFRMIEFNQYLEKFSNVKIYSSDPNFDQNIIEYRKHFPKYADRVFKFNPNQKYKGVAYLLFLNQVLKFLPVINANNLPFIFTLYPGGGGALDKSLNNIYKQIFSSKLFREVIVTQQVAKNYLLNNSLCPSNKINYIFGGPISTDFFANNFVPKKHYKKDKKTFDICFIAHNYTKDGYFKGFPLFVDVAKKMYGINNINFHVVGGHRSTDIDCKMTRVQFYGLKPLDFFPNFHSYMDIILSPTQVGLKGSYDGFPTGSIVHAGLSGVGMFCCDPSGINVELIDKKEIVIIPNDCTKIVETINYYYNNYDELQILSKEGKDKLNTLFDINNVMQKYVNILSKEIELK